MDQSLTKETAAAFTRLEQVVATLRGENGCPWDIKQTPASLKKYLLEECQELAEAIDKGGEKEICEEIGDVFFILTMLIAMFAEHNHFTGSDVLDGIIAKMIRRHPHVFGNVSLADADELQAQWQRIKTQEKQSSSPTSRN
jgi:tetrapyrrole methylase family protein/MazG family protein/ATP diphosphatase